MEKRASVCEKLDEESIWYFGLISRQEANQVLMLERQDGVFIIRSSVRYPNDYVLSVREDGKVSNYVIKRKSKFPETTWLYAIGGHEFTSIEDLIKHYTVHYLNTTVLLRPAPKPKYSAKFDFNGTGGDDLPLKEGEVVSFVRKHKDGWYTVENSEGKRGSVPSEYLKKYLEEDSNKNGQRSSTDSEKRRSVPAIHMETSDAEEIYGTLSGDKPLLKNKPIPSRPLSSLKLPATGRVIRSRYPNAYDKHALKLEVGQIVTITKINSNGQWEGSIHGAQGTFPFNHIEIVTEHS